jgi:hypothetical protein
MANVFHRYLGKDGKMPKLSPEQRKEQARRNKLAAELTDERARAVRIKRQQAEMLLAKARGELISVQKIVLQASYLLRSLQQRIWYFPARYGNEILRALDLEQSRQQELNGVLKKVASEFMQTVRELPQCVEEGWLETLADDEDPEIASKAAEAKERLKKRK